MKYLKYFDIHTDILYDVYVHAKKGNPNRFVEYHLPQLKKAPIQGGVWTLYSPDDFDIVEAYEIALKHIPWEALKEYKIILGIEGMRNVKDLATLDQLYKLGLRHGMLTWNEDNHLAGGAKGNKTQGLTDLGKQFIDYMIEHDMIIDVSHLNEVSFYDVIHYTNKNVIASHSNMRALCDHVRNLDDKQLDALKDADGLLGLTLAGSFIHPDKSKRNMETFFTHLEYAIAKLGEDRVCFGFDFMDYFDEDQFTNLADVNDVTDIEKITLYMKEQGYSRDQSEKITHKNFLNKYTHLVK